MAHGQALRAALGDPVLGDRVTLIGTGLTSAKGAGQSAPTPRSDLAPTRSRGEDLAALRSVGLTDEECWDVAEIAAMYNYTNRMAMATNMLPNVEYHAMSR